MTLLQKELCKHWPLLLVDSQVIISFDIFLKTDLVPSLSLCVGPCGSANQRTESWTDDQHNTDFVILPKLLVVIPYNLYFYKDSHLGKARRGPVFYYSAYELEKINKLVTSVHDKIYV